jgi:surface polysaccharide O-acyltransferase-like enzyme
MNTIVNNKRFEWADNIRFVTILAVILTYIVAIVTMGYGEIPISIWWL